MKDDNNDFTNVLIVVLIVGIERGYRRTWYGRLKREDQHKLLNREEEKT